MNASRSIIALLFTGTVFGSELHWRNGEFIGGNFDGAEADNVVWSDKMFGEPLKVRRDVLDEVIRHKQDEKTQEPFSVRLADGSRLFGAITGWNAKTLEMKSERFGTLKIARDAVHSVRRLQAEGLLFAAPTSTHGWIEGRPPNSSSKEAAAKYWRVIPGAALKQVGWNRNASLPLKVPEKVEMQVTLSASVRPEFKLELKAGAEARLVVETWVDDVVLQGRAFQRLQSLADDDRRLTLTLFWDRATGRSAIFGADGKKLAELTEPLVEADEAGASKEPEKEEAKKAAPKAGGGLFGALLGVVQGAAQVRVQAAVAEVQLAKASSRSSGVETPVGLTLENKGPDLTLEALCIRSWDGVLPGELRRDFPRVELTDGHVLKGIPVRASAKDLTVADAAGKETTVPWEKVLEVQESEEEPPQSADAEVEVWFTDGEWVKGSLQHVRKETATLTTAWSQAPVACKITRLQRLAFMHDADEATEETLDDFDTLTINGRTLHGTLDAGGGPQPHWRPVGGLNAIAMSGGGDMEIVRSTKGIPEGLNCEALIYLRGGDVLPGRLRAIDSRRIDVESDLAELKELPPEKLFAVQFGGEALNLDGFEDKGWSRVRGAEDMVKRKGKDGLEFEPGGSWGHPSFMQVNEISFNLQSSGFNALRVRLFCDGMNEKSASTNLLFGYTGSEVCFGLEASGDQMDRQYRVRSDGPMPVRITVGDDRIEVFLNSVSARKITLNSKLRSGNGIIIEPFSLWGNGERKVAINSFKTRIAPGRVAAPVVEANTKNHALTVPRFRKEDPPRHALLAANGDVLRGVIEAATSRHFAVRSGLETVQVPRDRVKAVVWLVKPADDVSAAFEERAQEQVPPEITHWLLLNNGGRLGLKVESFAKDVVIGTHGLLGVCRVPLKEVYLIRSLVPTETAAMAALKDWRLKFAPEPVLPETGGESSPLLNQEPKPFKLPLLAGGEFDLAEEKGKVVVLDFWATWCGPCVKSLPEMIDELSAFDPKKVRFIGMNQAEGKEQVARFLETRGWQFEVALDASQRVGQQFGVEGIPHTVIVGPDGKVAYVKTGYEPGGAKKVAEVVRKLLEKRP
ncbi:MAG: TlpA disulfide reductase family protein [Prosthecobacter sp.]